MINPFRPEWNYGDTVIRANKTGRAIGVYDRHYNAFRFEDCTIRKCLDEYDAWRFIVELSRQRSGYVRGARLVRNPL
jgi:hypothetical protein